MKSILRDVDESAARQWLEDVVPGSVVDAYLYLHPSRAGENVRCLLRDVEPFDDAWPVHLTLADLGFWNNVVVRRALAGGLLCSAARDSERLAEYIYVMSETLGPGTIEREETLADETGTWRTYMVRVDIDATGLTTRSFIPVHTCLPEYAS